MADTRPTTPQPENPQKPATGRTATPSNVPQTAGPANEDGPSREDISRRAYELFQKRGGRHGYHVEDWYEAERQLQEEGRRQTGASTAKTTAKKSAAKKATAKKSAAKKSTAKKSAAKKTGGEG